MHLKFDSSFGRKHAPWIVLLILLFVLGGGVLRVSLAAETGPSSPGTPTVGNGEMETLYLPLVSRRQESEGDFTPDQDTTLSPGLHVYDSMHIPVGVTVRVEGETEIQVLGDTRIDGQLSAPCSPLRIIGTGDMVITGRVDNRCNEDEEILADLTLATQGTLTIGATGKPADIQTSGELTLTNALSTPEWEFALLPGQRSSDPLAPVCALTASSEQEFLVDNQAVFSFSAEGIDPDGGPVSFQWDSGAMGPNADYTFTAAGVYTVTVTGVDDEGATCTATAQVVVESVTHAPDGPAVVMAPLGLTVAVGEPLLFDVDVHDLQGDPLTFAWSYGDGAVSTVITGSHVYTAPGRYDVHLTVTDANGSVGTGTASVYVYEPSLQAAAAAMFCPPAIPPPGAVVINAIANPPPPAGNRGRNGVNRVIRARNHLILGPGLVIRAGDGEDGRDRIGAGYVRAGRGGRGGSISIVALGSVSVCAGVELHVGDGGDGGNATANTDEVGGRRIAWAVGGKGGDTGRRAFIAGGMGVFFDGAVTFDLGEAGDGGNATANGAAGANDCPVAEDGAEARARGGNGGKASKQAVFRGRVQGVANVTVQNGLGGDGGNARARSGAGGIAACPDTATGGAGGPALARAGRGGDARLTGNVGAGFAIAPNAFTAGDGGDAVATSGSGGDAVATGKACSPASAMAGEGGLSTARGGDGGRGRTDGLGGDGDAIAGSGGDATANGGDCMVDCKAGGNGSATGGRGGDADALKGRFAPGGIRAMARAGNGGMAAASGGKGADCSDCPGGAGGAGGAAVAVAGDGGEAIQGDDLFHGHGGDALAMGGEGGRGANCCGEPGGSGGPGGDATANAGRAGGAGALDGFNFGWAGDGGDGGDGAPPGSGGPGGTGAGWPIPLLNGNRGADGNPNPPPLFALRSELPICVPTPTVTPTVTVTPMPTMTVTPTPTPTVASTMTVTPTPIPTVTVAPTMTATSTVTPTPFPTVTVTSTMTVTPTPTPTVTVTSTMTATLTPTAIP